MAILRFRDIRKIGKEYEEQAVRYQELRHYRDDEYFYWEARMDSEHGDWGDRD